MLLINMQMNEQKEIIEKNNKSLMQVRNICDKRVTLSINDDAKFVIRKYC